MFRATLLLLLAAGPAAAQLPPRPPGYHPEPVPAVAFRPAADRPDPVLRWNEVALRAIQADRTPPPVAARNLAVVHVAVYDAVNAVYRTHRPFFADLPLRAGTSPDAAAAAAAHRALTALYPRHAARLDEWLADSLAAVTDGTGKDEGVALGRAVADRVLARRAGDLAAANRTAYTPGSDPGRWRPTPDGFRPALLPGWTGVPCFALADPTTLRPPGPPALTSEAFTTSYRQVKALGAADSRVRTRDQTAIAHFWADGEGTVTPPGHWNRIARTVAADRRTTLVENARLFAMLNVAMADAAIACWDCKYRFDFWRPVTAIREAHRLSDPALAADPAWAPLLPTPPFPAYTSGHSSFSGAAAAVLAAFFGTDDVRFDSTSDGLPGAVRSFTSFSAAANEAGWSRIYGGIHWDFDNRDGLAGGRKVGEYVARTFFRPAK